MTIKDAAISLGMSRDTVRRKIRKGEITGHRLGNKWMVELPDEPTGSDDPAEVIASSSDLVDNLQDFIKGLQEQLSSKDRQISELHVLLSQRAIAPPSRPWWRRVFGG